MTPSPSPHGPMTPLHKKAKGLRNRQRTHLHPGSTQHYKGRLRRVSPISNPPQNHLCYPSYCPRLLPPLLVNSKWKVITSLWHSTSDGPLSFVNLHGETFLLWLFHLIFSKWKEKWWYPGRNCLWEHDCLPLFSVTLFVRILVIMENKTRKRYLESESKCLGEGTWGTTTWSKGKTLIDLIRLETIAMEKLASHKVQIRICFD